MRTYIQINPADNVVVAVKDLQTGVSLDINGRTIVVLQDIPAGHKVALQDFKEGDHIIKYGAPIGHAREVITTGSWVNEKISRPTWKGYGNMNSIRNLFRNSHPESHFLLKDIAAKWRSGNPERDMGDSDCRLRQRHHAPVGRSVTTGDTRHRSRCDRRIPS